MPASGKKGEGMSDAELEQRSEATLKHGVYSKKITPEKASQLAELEDQLSTRPGVVAIQNEQAAKAVQMLNVAISYAVAQHQEGKPLDRIPVFKMLPAFMNSAQRALKQLHEMLPDESQMLDEGVLLMELRREDADEDEED